MSYHKSFRAYQAALRREERDAQRRQRELERRAKEQAKLDSQEQARLQVETYDNRIELLLSVHKEQGEVWDWTGIAGALSPPKPKPDAYHELKAKKEALSQSQVDKEQSNARLEAAKGQDRQIYQQQIEEYSKEKAELEKLQSLAKRILDGDFTAYADAFVHCNPVAEINALGTSVAIRAHSTKLVECRLSVLGTDVIPPDIKSLTSTGKLSSKAMPRAKFHELYQDYVCACMLRVVREVFALLPVDDVLITAVATSGEGAESKQQPVLSAVLDRSKVSGLTFNEDPSDTIESFPHRGDFKASRKSGAFLPIQPIGPEDLTKPAESRGLSALLRDARRLREGIRDDLSRLQPATAKASE